MNDKFIGDLTKFARKARGNLDEVVRKVVIDIGVRVVLRSPVGDPGLWKNPAPAGYTGGHFRANWQYTEVRPAEGMLESAIDTSGRETIARIASSVRPEGAGTRIHFISNNLPYAMRLETGWSSQAPAGMVGLTVREFRGIVGRIVSQVKK